MPEISVLMSVYNESRALVAESVGSILAQTYGDFEFIIMCDDPANSAAIAFLEETASRDRRVRVYVNEKNLGLVGSLNRGLQYCEGKYIARMDADDRSLPERFRKQKDGLERLDLDMIGCLYRVYFGPGREGRIEPSAETPEEIREALGHYDCMSHPTWFAKREVFESLGGYRDIRACEDYDFLIRAARAGFRLGNLQDVYIWYRISPGGISQSNRAVQRTITRFLAYNMRHDRDTSMDDMRRFLASNEYRRLKGLYEAERPFRGDKTVKGKKDLKNFIALAMAAAAPGALRAYMKYRRD